MKNQTIRNVLTVLLFAAWLANIGCGTAGPANSPNNAPQNIANGSPSQTDTAKDGACDLATADEKVRELNVRIAKRFTDDPKFRSQFEGENGKPPTFRFWAVNNNGIIELVFKGTVSGKDEKGNSKLEGILDIIDGYLDKASCIQRVRFVPGAITSAADVAPMSGGFEWNFCESPQIPCPNGQCANDPPGCPGIGGSSNMNSGPKANANTNANANSNTNTTKGSNMNAP